jgi:tetratricopeptide (TPR) repeat protein
MMKSNSSSKKPNAVQSPIPVGQALNFRIADDGKIQPRGMRVGGLVCGLTVCLLGAGVSGCAGWGTAHQAVVRNTAGDVDPAREDRKKALIRDFDQQRDDAQLDAAASCWQRGDVDGCNRILGELLARNPNNRRAGLLLADVDLFNGSPEDASAELEKLVNADPKDAMAQHALAQVWDACGHHQDALAHYEAATQLDPKNEVYALSYKAALGMIPHTDPNTAVAAAQGKPGSTAPAASKAAVPSGVQLASASMPIANPPVVNAPIVNPPIEGTPILNTPEATDQAAWRLNDASMQNHPQTFAPPAKPGDWVDRLDFEPTAGDETLPAKQIVAAPLVAPAPLIPSPANVASAAAAATPAILSTSAATPKQLVATPSAVASTTLLTSGVQPVVAPVQPAFQAESPAGPQILQDPLHRAVAALARADTEGAIEAASRGLAETPDQAAALYRVLGTAHYRRGEYQAAQAALCQALSLDKSDALSYFLMGSTLDKLADHEAAQRCFSEAARLDRRFAN